MTQVTIGRRTLDVQWTLLDRAVAAVSPSRGMARWQQRTQMALGGVGGRSGGYDGGRKDRRGTRFWRPRDGSAEADVFLDLPDLRARSRDLVRNVPIATGALATRTTNVVGSGLKLIACIDKDTLGISEQQADAMEREQEREFELFWKSCDLSRVQHGDELAALSYRSQSESGDAFVIRRFKPRPGQIYGTRLQLIEADRVSNPNRQADSDTIAGGIEYDKPTGEPLFAYVTDKHPGGLRVAALVWEKVPFHDGDGRQLIIHLFDRLRPELLRGAPWLGPVIELIKQLGSYTDAEVTAAVVTSMYTVTIESDADSDEAPVAGETDQSLNANEIKLGAGAVLALNPGEKANFDMPVRPNPQFDPFFLAMTRQIGVALEIPQELLIKHFTASYSASRAALGIAFQGFLKERKAHGRRLYQVAYEWMMEEAVAMGRLNRPGFFTDPRIRLAYCGAEWRGEAPLSLNPYQEAQADDLDMKNGAKTLEQVCAERTGGEAPKKISVRGKEIAAMTAAGFGPGAAPAPGAAAVAPMADANAKSDAEDETKSEAAA